jgi:hypothetical protein
MVDASQKDEKEKLSHDIHIMEIRKKLGDNVDKIYSKYMGLVFTMKEDLKSV